MYKRVGTIVYIKVVKTVMYIHCSAVPLGSMSLQDHVQQDRPHHSVNLLLSTHLLNYPHNAVRLATLNTIYYYF